MRNSTQPTTTTSTATKSARMSDWLCTHTPKCPTADSPDAMSARVIAAHPEQGWSLLCNALLFFEDTGELLPDGQIIDPHRPTDTTLSSRPTAAHALLGGAARSGKTDAAVFSRAASPASSSRSA